MVKSSDKILKQDILYIFLIFVLSFALNLLAVALVHHLTPLVILSLFLSTSISFLVIVTILGGVFTSLSASLHYIRRLIKLTNLTNPLLLRLSSDAPGTYHHSVIVADLSSKAAKAIGADSLLCRVASYFHDIGKLSNPKMFIENQKQGFNIHNFNQPLESVNIIKSHISEGIKMAKAAHLPNDIINLIAQHHGTSLCGSFYEEAKKQNPNIKQDDFRYNGPKPQSKEAGIIMLADAIEAKTRVENNPYNYRKIVEETILEKIKDKQLDESSLSNREIARLKKSFEESLKNIAHRRIEYK